MAKKDNVKKPASIIRVPEYIDYPDSRFQIPANLLEKNDEITIKLIITNKFGVEKYKEIDEIKLKEFPNNGNTVIGRLSFNLVETN